MVTIDPTRGNLKKWPGKNPPITPTPSNTPLKHHNIFLTAVSVLYGPAVFGKTKSKKITR